MRLPASVLPLEQALQVTLQLHPHPARDLPLNQKPLVWLLWQSFPIVIVNVQRGGPSTGLPTKTEQADLLQALYGSNGESPVVVLAASAPSDCFKYAYEAARIAIEHMTPVILLTDGYLANGSEPWRIPDMKDLPEITPPFAGKNEIPFHPYKRNCDTLARYWAIPGTAGLEHRIGGLEKTAKGTVSYLPENHEQMVNFRAGKVARVAEKIPDLRVIGGRFRGSSSDRLGRITRLPHNCRKGITG